MKVTLLAVVIVTAVASVVGAADPECLYRKLRGLSVHWPNPSDCASYYRCSNKNVMKAITCPAGKEYNPKNGKCSTAGRGLCKLSMAAPLKEVTNVCSNEVSGAWVQNSENCGEYFICDNNMAYPQTCALGSYFNATLSHCEPDTGNECWQNKCIDQPDGSLVASSTSCASYYICKNQEATIQTCQRGYYYDAFDEECIVDLDNTHCWENFCIGQQDGAYASDPDNCGIFYICYTQTPIPQDCPTGSYFILSGQHCIPGTCEDMTSTTTTTTTESPSTGCDCADGVVNGEMVQNKENCRLFYICDNGVMVSGDCLRNNYFDIKTNSCQYDTDKVCPDSSMPDCVDGDMAVDDDNCNQFFKCQNGVWESQTCPSGQYFQEDCSACVPDTNNVCPQCDTDDGSAPTITSIIFDTQSRCLVSDPIQRSANCFSYFVCISGSWKEQSCPAGSYFDVKLSICQIDTDDKCPANKLTLLSGLRSKRSVDQEPEPEAESEAKPETVAEKVAVEEPVPEAEPVVEEEPVAEEKLVAEAVPERVAEPEPVVEAVPEPVAESEPVETVPEPVAEPEPVAVVETNCTCPDGSSEGDMVPHPTDCGMYLICQNQQLIDGSCGVGNIFCSSQGICVPDTDATCWVCANKPNGYQMIDPTDCTSYVTCNNGLAVSKTCPAGEYFTGSICEIDVTGQCINPCTCGNGNVPHPVCSKYFQCTDGVPQVVDCPVNQGFDASTQQCSAKVTCAATACANATDGTIIPIKGDDTKFYICYNNVATIRACPANTALDPTFLICLPVPSTNCDQTKCTNNNLYAAYPTLNGDNSTFCYCQADGAYVKSCPSGYSFDSCENVCTFTGPCDPQVCVNADEYTPSVNYEDPNSFCLCRVGQQVPVPCPIGYTFNGDLLLCVLIPIPDPRCCRGYCAGKPDDMTFPAIDTDTGFCLCVDEVPSYRDCPPNKVYDPIFKLCLEPYAGANCTCNECNPAECANSLEYEVFPAEGNDSGFCYCKEFCPVFTSCPNGTAFDTTMGLCLKPPGPVVCDATKCDTYLDYQPYPSLNGTDGFCYCDGGIPIYTPCPLGKQYSEADGMCLETMNGETSCYCDSEKCSCYLDYQPFPSTNADDETSFCYCNGGTAYYDNCPNDKVFDPTEGMCLRKSVSECICAPGKCSSLPANGNYAALNTTFGFCQCVDGAVIYESCPAGKEYNVQFSLCLASTGTNKQLICDSSKCDVLPQFGTFAFADTTSAFCVCNADGSATYATCPDGHMYDELLGSCIVDVCDPLQCRSRVRFEAFSARNTTKGFCACDIIPTYYHCTAGHVFDVSLGVCVDEVTAMVAACDPRECRKHLRNQPFEAKNSSNGFCSCDGDDEIVTYHRCATGMLFDRVLNMCLVSEHVIQKRSVEPEEKFGCEVNEKRSLPSNCSQFEICVDGNWRKRTCSEERYYNPEQQRCLEPRDDMVCNYARVPGLPECNALSESDTIPGKIEKNTCMQYFRCNAGRWRLRSCPKRHYYAANVNTCLPMPTNVGDDLCSWINHTEISTKCIHLTARPSPTSCSTFLMCTENAWWVQHCPLGMYFSRKHNYCQPNDANQCRLEGNKTCTEGQRRVISTSCRSYDLCIGGKWVNRTCHPFEQFEPQLGCILNNGSCHGNGLRRVCNPGELLTLPATNSNCTQEFYYCESDEWHLASCLRGHTFVKELNKCQAQDKCQVLLKDQPAMPSCLGQPDGQSVPNLDDCTRFYLCLHEQPALPQNCATGSFFDSVQGYCRPNDGSCQQIESICDNKTQDALVPHLHNCRAYYNCSVQNSAQLLYCPKGQYFDSFQLQCRLDLGQCKQQIMSDSETSLGLCTGVSHGSHLPHKLYCNLYYVCVRGLAISVQCDDKKRFNVTSGECSLELESDLECLHGQLNDNLTSSAVYSCDTLQDGSYVPDFRDCTRYFICAGGVALTQRCSAGAYFDAEQLLCLPDDGYCPYVGSNSSGSGNDTSIRNLPPNPLLCEGKHGFIIPDKSNCNNFYICISNKLRSDRCYEGYYFNATLLQCQPFELITEGEKDLQTEAKADLRTLLAPEQEPIDKQSQKQEKCRDAPTDFVNLCDIISEGSSTAEPGDCRRYISCDQKEPISQRCRNGESFDSLLGICRQNDGTCSMENGERVGVCSGKHGQLARDIHNCRSYFVCVHGQKIEAECDQGYYFNKTTNSCELDLLQQCNSNSNEMAKPKIDEIY